MITIILRADGEIGAMCSSALLPDPPHFVIINEMKKTGKWPYGFVWCYDDASIWGKPVAITEEAKQMEKEFNVSSI